MGGLTAVVTILIEGIVNVRIRIYRFVRSALTDGYL